MRSAAQLLLCNPLIARPQITALIAHLSLWLIPSLHLSATQLSSQLVPPILRLQPPHLLLQLVDLGVEEPLVAGGDEVPPTLLVHLPALRSRPDVGEQVVGELVQLLLHSLSPTVEELVVKTLLCAAELLCKT